MAYFGAHLMVTEPLQPQPAPGPAYAETLRLRQQLAAREEAIRQLTKRNAEEPYAGSPDVPEPDQNVLADALASGIELQAEIQRLRHEVAGRDAEIAALRHQLGVYDRLGLGAAVGGVQKVRQLLRKPGARS
jgi:hypothetical protein